MKLLPLQVYRTRYEMLDNGAESDCTNGGVSAKHHTVYVICPEGHVDSDKVDPSLIFKPEHRGGNYWALIPTVTKPGMCGPMDGGNLAETCDSRGKGIIYHIHDRFETWEQYEVLSR